MSNLPPITPEGLGGLLLWLTQAKSGKPDHNLLLRGLPQGRIKRARVTDDGSVAVVIEDQRTGKERSERSFDPEAFFVLRILCVPKTYIRIDQNTPTLHYLTLYDDVTAHRVIADAGRDQAVNQIGSHYDLGRHNLVKLAASPGPKVKPVHQGRADVTRLALEAYDKLSEKFWLKRLLQHNDLAWLLAEGFQLLDERPLGDITKAAAE